MKMRTIDNRLFFDEVAEQLARGHAVRIRARGSSMLPFIRDGRDVLVLEKPGEDSFRRGCLLLARLEEDRYVIHRVVKVQGEMLWLRGDGNLKVYELCRRAEVQAEVTEVVRGEKIHSSEALAQREQREQKRRQRVRKHGQWEQQVQQHGQPVWKRGQQEQQVRKHGRQRGQQVQKRGQQVQQRGPRGLQLQSKQPHGQRAFIPRSIVRGSMRWNAYRFLWPSHPFLRRVGLAIYRRINKQ